MACDQGGGWIAIAAASACRFVEDYVECNRANRGSVGYRFALVKRSLKPRYRPEGQRTRARSRVRRGQAEVTPIPELPPFPRARFWASAAHHSCGAQKHGSLSPGPAGFSGRRREAPTASPLSVPRTARPIWPTWPPRARSYARPPLPRGARPPRPSPWPSAHAAAACAWRCP